MSRPVIPNAAETAGDAARPYLEIAGDAGVLEALIDLAFIARLFS